MTTLPIVGKSHTPVETDPTPAAGIRLPGRAHGPHNTAGERENVAGVPRAARPTWVEPEMPSEDLLALLVCPMGKAPLRLEGRTLVCTRCGPRFAINDDIPNMLIEEAQLPEGCGSLADLECVKSGQAKVDAS